LLLLLTKPHNMPTTTTIVTSLAGVLAVLALAVYFFGIPPELKRKMEKAALKTMGENKASYMLKGAIEFSSLSGRFDSTNSSIDQISKIPASDQEDVKELKKGLSDFAGKGTQNPIGEEGGELADKLTSPLTGR